MPWWTLTFWTMLVAVAAYASARGGGVERSAAAMLLGAAIATVLVRSDAALRYSSIETGVLTVDALLLVGLIAVAVHSGRWWSIALATLQAVTLLGHLGKRLDPDLWRLGYAIMITAPAYPGLIALAIGTWQHRRAERTTSNAISSGRSSNTSRGSMRSGRLGS